MVGVDSAKDQVYARLRIAFAGPGYCHFPSGRERADFDGLTSETVVVKYSKGFPVREYRRRPGMANEPLDCRVYAYAALCSLGRVNWAALARRKDAEGRRKLEAPAAQDGAVEDPMPAPQKRRRAPGPARNWTKDW